MGQETNLNKLSTEELLKLKENRINHMTDNLEGLRIQDEFSRLKANISENTLREHMSKMKLAQMMAKPEKTNEEDESN
jgi:hypothetical protein